jgi:hypothetical protein
LCLRSDSLNTNLEDEQKRAYLLRNGQYRPTGHLIYDNTQAL